MANEARQATTRIIDLAEQGVLCWEQIARDCMDYMSEIEVRDMANANDYFEGFQEDDQE